LSFELVNHFYKLLRLGGEAQKSPSQAWNCYN
jgi:hypothetical protein